MEKKLICIYLIFLTFGSLTPAFLYNGSPNKELYADNNVKPLEDPKESQSMESIAMGSIDTNSQYAQTGSVASAVLETTTGVASDIGDGSLLQGATTGKNIAPKQTQLSFGKTGAVTSFRSWWSQPMSTTGFVYDLDYSVSGIDTQFGGYTLFKSTPEYHIVSAIGSANSGWFQTQKDSQDPSIRHNMPYIPSSTLRSYKEQSMQVIPDCGYNAYTVWSNSPYNTPTGIPNSDAERNQRFAEFGGYLTSGGKIATTKPDWALGHYLDVNRFGTWNILGGAPNTPLREAGSGYTIGYSTATYRDNSRATTQFQRASYDSFYDEFTTQVDRWEWNMFPPSATNYMYGKISYSYPIGSISVAEDIDEQRIADTLSFSSSVRAIGFSYDTTLIWYREPDGQFKSRTANIYQSQKLGYEYRLTIDNQILPALVTDWISINYDIYGRPIDFNGNYFSKVSNEQKLIIASRIIDLAYESPDSNYLSINLEIKTTKTSADTSRHIGSFMIQTTGENQFAFNWYGYSSIKANIRVNIDPILTAMQNFGPSTISSLKLVMRTSPLSNIGIGISGNAEISLSKNKYEPSESSKYSIRRSTSSSLNEFTLISPLVPNLLSYYKGGFYINFVDLNAINFPDRASFLSGLKIYEVYWEYDITKLTYSSAKINLPAYGSSMDYINWEYNINSAAFNGKAATNIESIITNPYIEITDPSGGTIIEYGAGVGVTNHNVINPIIYSRTLNMLYPTMDHYFIEDGIKIMNPEFIRYGDRPPTMQFYIESAAQPLYLGSTGGYMYIYKCDAESKIDLTNFISLETDTVTYNDGTVPFTRMDEFIQSEDEIYPHRPILSIKADNFYNYDAYGNVAVLSISEQLPSGAVGFRYFNTNRYNTYSSDVTTRVPHIVSEDNFEVQFKYFNNAAGTAAGQETKFLVTAMSPLVTITGAQNKYTLAGHHLLNATLEMTEISFGSLAIYGSEAGGFPSIKAELTIENTGPLAVELYPLLYVIPKYQTLESMFVGNNSNTGITIEPSETATYTTYIKFNCGSIMPLRNSYFYLQINFYAYLGEEEVEIEGEMVTQDVFETLETYQFDDKYFFYSSQRGTILDQFEYDAVLDEDSTVLSTFEQSYSRLTYTDQTIFIFNVANENYLVPTRSNKAAYIPPSLIMVNIGALTSPLPSMTTIAGPISITNTIYNSGGLGTIFMKLKYRLMPEMIGSALDTGDGYYYKTLTVSGSGDTYYFRYSQVEFDTHVIQNWLQVLPTSPDYYLFTTAMRYVSTYLGVDYYLYDAREFNFQYNPQITIRPVNASSPSEFPVAWKNDPYLSLKTIGYYNVMTDGVQANSLTYGVLNLHLSPLYTPLKYKVDMGTNNDDISNLKLVQRYFNPSAGYLIAEIPKIQNNIVYPKIALNQYSEWEFNSYYQFNTISYQVPTPSMRLESFIWQQVEGTEVFEAIVICSNVRRSFTNISGLVPIQIFDSDYELSLKVLYDGYYYDIDDPVIGFSGRFSAVFGEIMSTQTLFINLDQIGEGETIYLKVIGERIYVAPTDYSPLIFGFAASVFAGLIWVVFTYRSSEYSSMNNTLYSKLGTGKYIIATAAVVAAAFTAMYVFLAYF